MAKAISLLSGGLDSILATKLILEQGVDVEAVYFLSVFCNSTARQKSSFISQIAADKLRIKLKVFEISKELSEIVKNPRYGYGANINPCLDCHAFMFKKAGEYMKRIGATFLITGEVLGERPMSQRKDALRIIDRDSGWAGLILRPLSAKLLEATNPERQGLVNREKLFCIQGRSRKTQIKLAQKYGIKDYPTPAGGCLLTDPGFARRMKDLMKHKPDFTIDDIQLLKIGRHFRLAPEAKLIVGRDEKENDRLVGLLKDGDLCFYPTTAAGPTAIGSGVFNNDNFLTASRIVVRYSDKDSNQKLEISYKKNPEDMIDSISVSAITEDTLKNLRI